MNQTSYPYKFDNTAIFFPMDWKEDFGRVVNSSKSESGEDMETVIRRKKLSVSVHCKATSDWLATFEDFSDKESFVLSRYDASIDDYTTHTVRMTSFSPSRIKRSEDIDGTIGLWDISFKLEEF